jgi:hypothetical protein
MSEVKILCAFVTYQLGKTVFAQFTKARSKFITAFTSEK